jgi:hypothetical protein
VTTAFLPQLTTTSSTRQARTMNNGGAELMRLHAEKKKPPIYITIGPQCAGKTTFLSQLQQRISKDPNQRILDVTMDDQEGVYLSIDVKYFLERNKNDRFFSKRFIGKTIGSRIAEQTEVCTVLQRLAGRLTKGEFETTIVNMYRNHAIDALKRNNNKANNMTITDDMLEQDDHTRLARELIDVVEEVMESAPTLPSKIDLFCVEALFRPNPKTNMTGVDAAANQLKKYARTKPAEVLAWGNTNTRPREYKTALEAAADSGRQVYFLAYGNASRISNGVFLPVLNFQELLRRNVKRLLVTGKYVPAKGMWDSSQRVQTFMQSVMRDLDRAVDNNNDDDDGGDVLIPIHSKLDFDKRLAQMANFEMMEDRTVRFVPTRKKNNKSKSPTTRRRQTNTGPPSDPPPPASSSTQLHAWRMPQAQPWHQQQQSTPWNQQRHSQQGQNPWQKSGSWGQSK